VNLVITGLGYALPGNGTSLLGPAGETPVDPAARLGRKGLRYKDRATQLGLCAALDALRAAGLWDDGLTVVDRSVAVVVSSNLGNVDTVCKVAQTIGEEGSRGVSPMDTPNASSNILASEVAIRFGLRGPNLMVCNGVTSGLDAVHWASTMLRAGRADHVLVLGVEPDNEIVRQLVDADRVLDGAVGFVLERPGRENAMVRATIGKVIRAAAVEPRGRVFNLEDRWGTCSGALGIMQCAAAVEWFEQGGDGPVMALLGSEFDDAMAGLLVEQA
jgi:3-oxoacyl-[acyl-carrier-protein] synthase II